jgi:hypothetical protein
MGPAEELLGVVVHSGLVLGRSDGVVVALRRITAFPTGLSLDAVLLARDVHAEAAGRRAQEAEAQRVADATAQREDEADAQRESEDAARSAGAAAAERRHARKQAMIERRYLPQFDQGGTLRLGVGVLGADARWLDAYASGSSNSQDQYRLEASYWLTPLPRDGLLTLVCAWPEIGLTETMTDVILPDLAARAAETSWMWDPEEDRP